VVGGNGDLIDARRRIVVQKWLLRPAIRAMELDPE